MIPAPHPWARALFIISPRPDSLPSLRALYDPQSPVQEPPRFPYFPFLLSSCLLSLRHPPPWLPNWHHGGVLVPSPTQGIRFSFSCSLVAVRAFYWHYPKTGCRPPPPLCFLRPLKQIAPGVDVAGTTPILLMRFRNVPIFNPVSLARS